MNQDDPFREAAKANGPLPKNRLCRIVTREADGRMQVTDAAEFENAVSYADEAASEGGPVAKVFDGRFRVLYRGRHYVSAGMTEGHVKTLGPLPSGSFRVLVLESDPVGRASVASAHRDFPSLKKAAAYADAQAALSDDDPPLALVFDAAFKAVHLGLRRD